MPPPPPVAPIPPPKPWPMPKFHLRVEDLGHEGASIFFESVGNPITALQDAVVASFEWLYTRETAPTNVQSILLVLRPMDGVAHTLGSPTHKEIHFSLDHIKNSAKLAREEILGVLTHEVVHCYQYNARGSCPGGLIEGIADFVRLHANLSPPHWKRTAGPKWDAGYQITAYFLDWIETRYGKGTIQELNACMKDDKYHRRVFKELTGRPVRKLWAIYCKQLEEEKSGFGRFRVQKEG
ncbi:plant basic secretory protein [Crucibulum laeve]|uniref:Plant basic secretory protein n=1 Tax=Crucibulum laeve TaxID=68775 RepID=A0A5C3MC47_9AGAR|nr:plant basic secretory protein [Crucibulum laeve]